MSKQCLIKNSEYRTKLAQSGISEPLFYSFANSFVAKHGRFPNLDEIPKVDSRASLNKELNIKDDSAKIEDILAVTQTQSVQEANIVINDIHSDLEVNIMPINKEALVTVTKRPSQYEADNNVETFEVADNINTAVVFNNIFTKLSNLYGINIIPITDHEVSNYVSEVHNVSAFIHEGNIYVNTDLADVDAPIHEMTHMLLGSIRFKNPELYQALIQTAESFPRLYNMILNNPNRAYSDILEEAFVQETGRYLAGLSSQLNLLDKNVLYELHYNFKRLLDSVLMGQYSVKSVPDTSLYTMSLTDLARTVNSQTFTMNSNFSMDDAKLHRMLSNKKSDLMKKGDLREEC